MVQHARRWVAAGMICVGMLASATAARAADDEMVDSPQYQSWAKYKPGTSVTMVADMDMHGMKMKIESTTTLVSVTPDTATLSVAAKVEMMGQSHPGGPPQQRPLPAKMKKADVKQVGTEDVTAAGKTYSCKVYEVSGSQMDITTPGRGRPGGANPPGNAAANKAKIWVNEDVPGGAVRIEVTAPNGQPPITMTLASVDVK